MVVINFTQSLMRLSSEKEGIVCTCWITLISSVLRSAAAAAGGPTAACNCNGAGDAQEGCNPEGPGANGGVAGEGGVGVAGFFPLYLVLLLMYDITLCGNFSPIFQFPLVISFVRTKYEDELNLKSSGIPAAM